VYEYETEKKIFSKRTYNEIPAGFELKKNLHIKYADPNLLNHLIAILSRNEIYDLVRVDYLPNNMEKVKKDLAEKTKDIALEKIKHYELLLGESLSGVNRQITDGYRVVLPVETYRSYDAYNNSSLNLRKAGNVSPTTKQSTLYYQPIVDKEFDFVDNPVILEPVVQVMYEVKILINREKKPVIEPTKPQSTKQYILITPTGEVKNLNLP
jgi:hypothetical protein